MIACLRNDEVVVRLGTAADVPAFCALGVDAGLSLDVQATWDHLGQAHGRLVVASRGGELLGGVLGQALAQELEIFDVVVRPDQRRQGLGLRLMQHVLRSQVPTCLHAFVEVAADNGPALALYRRLNFAQVGLRKAYYERSCGAAQDALVLRVALS